MKILLTNHFLLYFRGSELFSFEIARALTRKGHSVTVYSKYIYSDIYQLFHSNGIRIIYNLSDIKEEKFDIAHVHHNINAYEVRYYFPNLPIIFLSHGVIHEIEYPPIIDLGIRMYLAVSEEVKDNLIKLGIKEKMISLFRNGINSKVFYQKKKINNLPRKALIISTRLNDEKKNIIISALKKLGIEYQFIGGRFGWIPNKLLPYYINKADIVFSLGRGAIEAMFCGRVPIIFDYLGGEGMVTPSNILKILKFNFSGRCYKKEFNFSSLVGEIKKYRKEYGSKLQNITGQMFDIDNNIISLISLYKQCILDFKHLNYKLYSSRLKHIVYLIGETKYITEQKEISKKEEGFWKRKLRRLRYEILALKIFLGI
jgi:hypothetical protein